MTNTLTISRELLPCPFCGCEVQEIRGFDYIRVYGTHGINCPFLGDDPLIAEAKEWNTRAAPAVERQEPIYQVQYLGDGGGGWTDAEKDSYDAKVPHPKHWRTRIVFTSPPAPVAVQDESIIRDAERYRFIRNGTAEANYICLSSVQGDMDAAIDACLDKVKEMN